jgi:hypothetical protein
VPQFSGGLVLSDCRMNYQQPFSAEDNALRERAWAAFGAGADAGEQLHSMILIERKYVRPRPTSSPAHCSRPRGHKGPHALLNPR